MSAHRRRSMGVVPQKLEIAQKCREQCPSVGQYVTDEERADMARRRRRFRSRFMGPMFSLKRDK